MVYHQSVISGIFEILDKHIREGDSVIAGISGGPDSTALLDLLAQFAKQTPYEIVVAHVNHGIRGAAAKHDENFVKNLAKKYGFKFEVKRVELAGKTHQEELGRKIRREFFEKLRGRHRAKWIITAHTADDQMETIIFNFLRGSGVKGLAGMQVQNGFYLKPLLNISKKEILKYLTAGKLEFCSDRTNEDTKYSRNLIRKKIVLPAEKLNPSLKKTLLRSASIFGEINEWLKVEANNFLKKQKAGKCSFRAKDFLVLPKALQQTVIQTAYQICTKYSYQLPAVKVEEILRMIKRNIGKKKIITGKPAAVFSLEKGLVETLRG